MQSNYQLDLAIIQFSAYDNPSPLHTNRSFFSTFRSTTIIRPSFFFSKNREEVNLLHPLTNQKSAECSIDTKFQESCKFTSTYSLFRTTAFRWSFNVSLWVQVEKAERRSFFNVVSSLPENLDMQSYMEQFRALVSNVLFFRAKWCLYFLGLILQSFIFQHVTSLYFFMRIRQSFLQSNPLR